MMAHRKLMLALLLLPSVPLSARAEPLPLPPAYQAKVNLAMLRGVIYLKNSQGIDGSWALPDKPHRVGYAALPALALLECGMPGNHSVVQKAAAFISEHAAKEENTYDLALAIMFLDRLGSNNEDLLQAVTQKKAIDQMIQVLALRLIAGQTATGGWKYTCPNRTVKEHQQLKKALEDEHMDRSRLAAWLRRLPVFQDPAKLMGKDLPDSKKSKKKQPQPPAQPQPEDEADNSNTHFAALALWVAQRHGVRAERSFQLLGKRFRTSQNPDGGWGYKYQLGGGKPTTPAMTCTGLVGLAVERGFTPVEEGSGTADTSKVAAVAAGLAANPSPLNGLHAAKTAQQATARETERKKRTEEPVTLKALQALANHVGQPAGKIENIPLGDLYFLWALERVAMIYDLPTVGDKDWYRWGAEMLLANVKGDGHWDVKTFGDAANEVINSSFALLFLRQANLADDLTTKLRADPSVLDKPLLAKNEPPAEVKPATPPSPQPAPPPEKKANTEKSALASAGPSKPAPTSAEKSPAKQTLPPEPVAPLPATGSAAPPKETNKALLWGGAAAGVVLIGVALALVVMGMRQGHGPDDEREPRRSGTRKRAEADNRSNGASRKPKAKRKD